MGPSWRFPTPGKVGGVISRNLCPIFLTTPLQSHEPAEQQREPGAAADAPAGDPPAAAAVAGRVAAVGRAGGAEPRLLLPTRGVHRRP